MLNKNLVDRLSLSHHPIDSKCKASTKISPRSVSEQEERNLQFFLKNKQSPVCRCLSSLIPRSLPSHSPRPVYLSRHQVDSASWPITLRVLLSICRNKNLAQNCVESIRQLTMKEQQNRHRINTTTDNERTAK
jgi:hypothetical protein